MVNSRLASFAAGHAKNVASPYPEVTDAILPSSLTRVIPSTLVYSTTPPVLVCGTVSYDPRSRWFSWKQKEKDSPPKRGAFEIEARLILRICLQDSTPYFFHVQSMHTLFASYSVTPRLEYHSPFSTTFSPKGEEADETLERYPRTVRTRYRNIDLLSIGYAFRPDLRTD